MKWVPRGEGVVHTVQDRRWLGWKRVARKLGRACKLGRVCKGAVRCAVMCNLVVSFFK